MLMTLAVIGVSAFAHQPSGAVLAWATMGAAAGVFVPAQQARLVRLGGNATDLALALNLAALNVGISVGAAIGSGIVDRGGLEIVGYVGGAISLLAVGLMAGTTSRT
jgi:predicted MFS family arabinose efflux permease